MNLAKVQNLRKVHHEMIAPTFGEAIPLGQVGVKKAPENCWALAPMYFGLKSDLLLFLFIHELKLVAIEHEEVN